MRHAVFGLAVLTALAGSVPAFAQPVADTPETRLAAARALIDVMGGEKEAERTMAAMRPALIRVLTATGKVPLDRAARVVDEVELPILTKHMPEMLDARAHIFAKYFSPQEISELTAFYRSGVGQKMLAEQAAIAADTMASMRPMMRDMMQAAPAMEAKLKAETAGAPK